MKVILTRLLHMVNEELEMSLLWPNVTLEDLQSLRYCRKTITAEIITSQPNSVEVITSQPFYSEHISLVCEIIYTVRTSIYIALCALIYTFYSEHISLVCEIIYTNTHFCYGQQ